MGGSGSCRMGMSHRAVLNCTGGVLLPEHLPERLQKARRQTPEIRLPVGCNLKEAEQEIILRDF